MMLRESVYGFSLEGRDSLLEIPILYDCAVISLVGLSGFLPRIGVRGRLFAGMTVFDGEESNQ